MRPVLEMRGITGSGFFNVITALTAEENVELPLVL